MTSWLYIISLICNYLPKKLNWYEVWIWFEIIQEEKIPQSYMTDIKLKSWDVSQSVLEMVYKSHVDSIYIFNITA